MREREHEGLQLPEHLPPPLVVEEELGANAGPVPGSVHVPVDCVAEIRRGLASFLGAVPAREIGVPEASLLVDLSVLLEEAVEALRPGGPISREASVVLSRSVSFSYRATRSAISRAPCIPAMIFSQRSQRPGPENLPMKSERAKPTRSICEVSSARGSWACRSRSAL